MLLTFLLFLIFTS